jgi:hypothetical protein
MYHTEAACDARKVKPALSIVLTRRAVSCRASHHRGSCVGKHACRRRAVCTAAACLPSAFHDTNYAALYLPCSREALRWGASAQAPMIFRWLLFASRWRSRAFARRAMHATIRVSCEAFCTAHSRRHILVARLVDPHHHPRSQSSQAAAQGCVSSPAAPALEIMTSLSLVLPFIYFALADC